MHNCFIIIKPLLISHLILQFLFYFILFYSNSNNYLSGLANGPMFRTFSFRQVAFFAGLLCSVATIFLSMSSSFTQIFISMSIFHGEFIIFFTLFNNKKKKIHDKFLFFIFYFNEFLFLMNQNKKHSVRIIIILLLCTL